MSCLCVNDRMISYDALFLGLSTRNRDDLVLMKSFQYLCTQRIGEGGPDFFADIQLFASNRLQRLKPYPLVINESELVLDVLIEGFMGMEFLIQRKSSRIRRIPQFLGRNPQLMKGFEGFLRFSGWTLEQGLAGFFFCSKATSSSRMATLASFLAAKGSNWVWVKGSTALRALGRTAWAVPSSASCGRPSVCPSGVQ